MLSAEVIFKTNTRGCCCCCLVTKSCPTFCDPMGSIMPGFPVLHHLPESAQIQIISKRLIEISNFKNQMLCDSECVTFRWNDGYCTKWVLCSLFKLFCSFSQSVMNSLPLSKLLTVSKPPSPNKKLEIIKLFPGGSDGKASAYNARDPGSIPGSGRSPGEGNGNPLQYSCL